MPALTEFLDKPIRDPNGEAVAALRDLVVRLPQTDTPPNAMDLYPPVVGLVARVKGPRGSRDIFIPWDEVQSLTPEGAELSTQQMNLRRFQRRDGEIVLRDGLFDRQVVDLEGRRVVRINDLDLARRDGTWRLIAVDISPSALFRRMGWARVGQAVTAAFGRDFARKAPLIDWAQVAPVANDGEGALRLRVPRARLEVMRPADLARLVEQLTPQQGAKLLDDLDEAHAADTLEELEDEQQGQILRAMDPERAADLLEEMEPDEATDALQSITTEEAADLLKRMDREEASEVQELLGWPEDSAGGIMTTDYISVPDWASVEEVIAALRTRARCALRAGRSATGGADGDLHRQRRGARAGTGEVATDKWREGTPTAAHRPSGDASRRLAGGGGQAGGNGVAARSAAGRTRRAHRGHRAPYPACGAPAG